MRLLVASVKCLVMWLRGVPVEERRRYVLAAARSAAGLDKGPNR